MRRSRLARPPWLKKTTGTGDRGGSWTVSSWINPKALTAHIDAEAARVSGNTPLTATDETDETPASEGFVSFVSARHGDVFEINAPLTPARHRGPAKFAGCQFNYPALRSPF